ncbi:MAG: hypothetical protein U0R26_06090 [Solirubrobacterales bacterium]
MMDDGAVLLANRYSLRGATASPTVLVRRRTVATGPSLSSVG